jgi:hypothetical protein
MLAGLVTLGVVVAHASRGFRAEGDGIVPLALLRGDDPSTRVLRRGVRQRVAGVVVNARLNVGRAEYDALKAILFNCVRFGPEDQNRSGHADFRAHLAGRVAYVASLNPERGARLRELFDRIEW